MKENRDKTHISGKHSTRHTRPLLGRFLPGRNVCDECLLQASLYRRSYFISMFTFHLGGEVRQAHK